MANDKLRLLKSQELKLLQRRTDLQAELDRLVLASDWPKAEVADITRQRDRLEAELADIRKSIDAAYRARG